ncbi:MAG: hypothetical protein ACE5HV_14700, partial [Acidobacteriota bacterium]
IRFYRAEVDKHSDDYQAWFNLSQIYANRADHAAALEPLRQAIRAKPDFAVGYLYLGRSLVGINDPALYGQAMEAARHGLELGPPPEMRALGHYVLADVYNRLGRTEAAQRELSKAKAADRGASRR